MKLTKDNIKEVIAELTIEDKAMFCIGLTDKQNTGMCARNHIVEKLGIPSTVFADGPQGLRINVPTICYPCATLMAQSWDDELVEETTQSMGEICREFGVDVHLAPGMNIQRNVLNGRNFEYFSEDPLLTGHMAAAYVNGVQKNGVGSCIKHYCANSQETYRNENSSEVTERALREIYLKAFGYAVKNSNPYGVMTCYNKINGVYGAVNKGTVKDVLRDEFGFDNVVMSDWTAGGDRATMMKVTNDLYCGTHHEAEDIEIVRKAIEDGVITREEIDTCMEHVLNMVVRTNAFNEANRAQTDKVSKPAERAELIRKTASNGIVLLKNNETLPMAKGNLALFGNGSYCPIPFGFGSGGCATVNSVISLRSAAEAADGFTLNQAVCEAYSDAKQRVYTYRPGWDNPADDPYEIRITEELANNAAKTSDAAIMEIYRYTAEGVDNQPLVGDFKIGDIEKDNLTKISKAFHAQGKKVIMILNAGNQMETASWQNLVDAILYIAYPGEQLGNSVMDIISGKVNPCAKLAATWPVKYTDTPQAEYFPGSADKTCYHEDIYVGYRYYETFNVPVSYSFGYGLSYTTFKYSNFNVNALEDGKFELSVTITNTGNVAGREIAQFYVSIPDGKNEHPAKELCGYKKTAMLAPNASETVSVVVTRDEYKTYYYDKSQWITEAGTYNFMVGASVQDIRFAKEVEINDETLVYQAVRIFDDNRLNFARLSKKA